MSKLNKFKLWLDFVMIIVLILMYNTRVISLTFHEIGGLALLGVCFIHVVLNRKWVGAVTRKLFQKTTSVKTRIGYLVNLLLCLSFLLVGISGIFISKVVFHVNLQSSINWKSIHIGAAAAALVLIGIHVGLHYRYILNMFKKVITVPKMVARILSILFLVVSIGYGSYSFVSNNYLQWLTMPFTGQSSVEGWGDRSEMPDFNNGQGAPGEMPSGQDTETKADGTTTAYRTTSSTDDNSNSNSSDTESGKRQMPQNGDFGGGNFKGGNGDFHKGMGETASGGVLGILKVVADYFSIAMLFTSLTILLQVIFSGKKKTEAKEEVLEISDQAQE